MIPSTMITITIEPRHAQRTLRRLTRLPAKGEAPAMLCSACPLAHAMQEATGLRIDVTQTTMTWGAKCLTPHGLPEVLQAFVLQVDAILLKHAITGPESWAPGTWEAAGARNVALGEILLLLPLSFQLDVTGLPIHPKKGVPVPDVHQPDYVQL